jgi:hypothetical protein
MPDGLHVTIVLGGVTFEAITHPCLYHTANVETTSITALYVIDADAIRPSIAHRVGINMVNLWVYPDNESFPSVVGPLSAYSEIPPLVTTAGKTYRNWWDFPVYALLPHVDVDGHVMDIDGNNYQSVCITRQDPVIGPVIGYGALGLSYVLINGPRFYVQFNGGDFTTIQFSQVDTLVWPNQGTTVTSRYYQHQSIVACVNRTAQTLWSFPTRLMKDGTSNTVHAWRLANFYTDGDHSSTTAVA